MLFVFTTMALSLVFAYIGRNKVAMLLMFACLSLGVNLFLRDIYSPEDGFRIPWIQVRAITPFQQQPGSGLDTPERIVYGGIA